MQDILHATDIIMRFYRTGSETRNRYRFGEPQTRHPAIAEIQFPTGFKPCARLLEGGVGSKPGMRRGMAFNWIDNSMQPT